MATYGSSLRDKQIASLKKILSLNDDVEVAANDDSQVNGLPNSQIVWKVLVFDDLGREYACLLWSGSVTQIANSTGETVSSALYYGSVTCEIWE